MFQSVNKTQIKKYNNCKELYNQLQRSMSKMLRQALLEDGYYRTITHSTIKTRLERLEKEGQVTVFHSEPIYEHNLIKEQKLLLNMKCSSCENNQDCPYLSNSQKVRSFYYIEFQIHKTQ